MKNAVTMRKISLTINGATLATSAAANETLLETLRRLGHFEVKSGCEKGDCGACAVLVDAMALDSCLTLTWTVEGCAITTVSGLGSREQPHPLQDAFARRGAAQCGYCTPGMLIAAKSMLDNDTDDPGEHDIRKGLSGNFCRCTGYTKIYDAVTEAAGELRGKAGVK